MLPKSRGRLRGRPTTMKLVMVQQLACHGVYFREFDGLVADYSRQRVTEETMEKLIALAKVIYLNIKTSFSFFSLSLAWFL